MAGIGRHSRYWNDGLRPLYARVATTPSNLEYTRTIAPTRGSPSCSSITLTPSTVLVAQPLRADTFASLLGPNATTLLPKRPCFAPFLNESGNHMPGEHSRRKQKLSTDTFFRSLKIRLKPTVEQAAVLRRWMAAAQAAAALQHCDRHHQHHSRHRARGAVPRRPAPRPPIVHEPGGDA